jgi:hypothetical protein
MILAPGDFRGKRVGMRERRRARQGGQEKYEEYLDGSSADVVSYDVHMSQMTATRSGATQPNAASSARSLLPIITLAPTGLPGLSTLTTATGLLLPSPPSRDRVM